MKAIVRLSFVIFVLSSLFVLPSTAINQQDAVKWWLKSLQNHGAMGKSVQHQAQIGLRSTEAMKHRLDSMVIQGIETDSGMSVSNQKNVYHYNQYGQIILSESFNEKDENGNWIEDEKIISLYDAFGFKLSDTTYRIDSETNRLYSYEILDYRFNSKGVKLMESRKTKYAADYPWQGDFREEYQYDDNEVLIRQLSLILSDSDVWVPARKWEYTYDASGKLTTETQYYLDSFRDQWTGLEKREHACDSLHRDTSVFSYNFYPLEDIWALSNREQINYDTAGHIIRRGQSSWRDETQQWNETGKDEYAFDPFGNKILHASFGLNSSTKEWVPNYREEWSYDEKGNLVTETYFTDFMENRLWLMGMKSTYQYDLNIRSDQVVWPFDFEEFDMQVFNIITGGKMSVCMAETDTVIDLASIAMYYSPMEVLGLQPKKTEIVPWYYNTSTKTLIVDTSIAPTTVQLYDLQGRQVLSRKVTSSTTLSLNELKKGLYLIRINVSGTVQRGKLVVD